MIAGAYNGARDANYRGPGVIDDAPTELVLLVRAWMQERELETAPPEFRGLVTDVLDGSRFPAPTPADVHRVIDERLRALVDDSGDGPRDGDS